MVTRICFCSYIPYLRIGYFPIFFVKEMKNSLSIICMQEATIESI